MRRPEPHSAWITPYRASGLVQLRLCQPLHKRKNWLFAGSLRAGQRAAAIMSLIQSARLNGHEPFAYLKDVLERLPTQPYSRIGELLPHRWQPSVCA